MIRLSQTQLNLLATCPPLLQRTYWEQLRLPVNPEVEETRDWGSRFHLLMQQRELGLPIDSILRENPEMQHSLEALIEAVPQLFDTNQYTWRDTEHCRTLSFDDYLLTAIYDLLLLTEEKAEIIDWKTYLQPPSRVKLAQNWQTRLYLYILAETSAYTPEKIAFTYWFVKLPTQPKSLSFNYSEELHAQTKKDLNQLLSQLTEWIEAYETEGTPFPHRQDCLTNCPHSSMLGETRTELNWQNFVEEIEEISL